MPHFKTPAAQRRLAFVATLLPGLAAHFLLYSRNLLVLDGLWNSVVHISADWELSLGRWGLRLVDLARGGLVSAPIITLMALLFLACTAVLLCELLQPRDRVTVLLFSAALAVSPQVASILLDTYCADSYCLAVLLAVGGIYLLFGTPARTGRAGALQFGAAAGCFTLTLSFYQCYLGISALLALFMLYRLLAGDTPLPRVGRLAGRALAAGLAGALVYYAITCLLLGASGVEFADYGGASSLSVATVLAALPDSLRYSVHYLSEYFLFDGVVHNTVWHRAPLWLALFLVFALSQLLVCIRQKWFRRPLRLALMALCLLLLPPAISLIHFLTPTYPTNLIMSMPVAFVLPCLACCVGDAAHTLPTRPMQVLRVASSVLCALLLWTQLWQTQATYMAVEHNLAQAETVAQDVYSRAAQLPDYTADLPWMFVGSTAELADERGQEKLYARAGGFFTQDVFFADSEACAAGWEHFFDVYLGRSIVSRDPFWYPDTVNSDAFAALPVYPAAGCVQVLDGMVVVKFKEA